MSGQAIVTIGDKLWNVSIAATLTERATGLSGVVSMPASTGMLFDLGGVQPNVPITMGDMLFPLDIVFVGEDSLVNGVFEDVQIGQAGVEGVNARYFLEVNSGEAAGIGVGDLMGIEVTEEPSQGTDIMGLIMILMIVGVVSAVMKEGLR